MRGMFLSEVRYDFPNNRPKGSTFLFGVFSLFEKVVVPEVMLAGFAVVFCRS